MSDSMLLLEVRDVAKRFGSVVALKSATLNLVRGEIHALMGANGAGKSTLVKILTGVHPADAGTITINGATRVFRSPAEARLAGIVSVYQDPALVPDLTIGQNMRLADVPLADVRSHFADLGIEDVDPNALVRDIPYPVLRLIDLARALASNPMLLVLDEITAALPANLAERVFTVMRSWRKRGNSVIFISHRMAEVGALCDRATVLRDGVTVGIIDTAPGSGERIVSLMLGLDPTKVSPSQSARRQSLSVNDGPAALEVRDLCYGHMLKAVSFSLRAGEILGVAALEGQGQQELFDCIAGVTRSDRGDIAAHGQKLKLNHPGDAIAAGLVLVPANRLQALLPQRSIRENVALPLVRNPSKWGLINARAERERVSNAVKRLQIDTRAEAQLRRLSGGNQQKVVIAKSLAQEPRLIIFDEPTRGVDVGAVAEIHKIIRDLAASGAGVVVISSYLPEILDVSDRILVAKSGTIAAEFSRAEASPEKILQAAIH